MPKLIIHRVSEMENRFRKIKIEVDGKLVAKIKNGEKYVLDIPIGIHTIQAKIDWGKSNSIEIDFQENNEIELELKKGDGSVFYRAFLDYENYLQLNLM